MFLMFVADIACKIVYAMVGVGALMTVIFDDLYVTQADFACLATAFLAHIYFYILIGSNAEELGPAIKEVT